MLRVKGGTWRMRRLSWSPRLLRGEWGQGAQEAAGVALGETTVVCPL